MEMPLWGHPTLHLVVEKEDRAQEALIMPNINIEIETKVKLQFCRTMSLKAIHNRTGTILITVPLGMWKREDSILVNFDAIGKEKV
ncbi:hypothetical protein OPV22_012107 [Ensete ventricosum]|uniref:Uncharacterized protein n=1 Tax=Ensete ventricosum TaxID=4639 RepID=A0AAV8R0Q5_ENSVE|nr:hypothetical protein OPV22_012107 [Ensete ventricosum]